jgi:protocatechuate 3,4-dioxygenase beta subunit
VPRICVSSSLLETARLIQERTRMTRSTFPGRRRVLTGGATLLLGLTTQRYAQAAVAPTPAQALGPFYPRVLPADRDYDLVRIAGTSRDAQGAVAWVEGRVTDTSGAPLAGALVEIWQCDVHGRYLKPADDAGGPRDDHFQGYGQLQTGANGAYAFRTIRPVRYSGRPPHIHFQITHPRHPRLVTQLYTSETGEAAPSGYEASYRSLWVSFTPSTREAGALAARFDIVLA